ncbi:MAG: acylphosphatase [Xanthomonadales bacterium]|nr:acylphosphatase [Xanthomonadales bacterium]
MSTGSSGSALTECRRFRIKGRVQGVWFRESTRQQAAELGLTGHAVNCPDGSVEVLACGIPEALDRLRAWLQQGPPMAEVRSLDESTVSGVQPEGFRTGWSE